MFDFVYNYVYYVHCPQDYKDGKYYMWYTSVDDVSLSTVRKKSKMKLHFFEYNIGYFER